jgi:hypothetical protein
MDFEISPDPSDAERAAIIAALAAEESERRGPSPWAQTVLPERELEAEPEH